MITTRSRKIGRDKLASLANGDFETIKFLEGVQDDASAAVDGANNSMDAAIAAQDAANSASDSALLAIASASSAQSSLATLEVEQYNAPAPDHYLSRRLEELEALLSESVNYQSALAKAVSELRDELGDGYPVVAETAATIKAKLGITTLSGSNTGDQTLASLGAAAVGGSSSQAFSASTLTASSSITSSASIFYGTNSIVVTTIGTPVTFPGIDAQNGILRIRDSSLGGSCLVLLDPNAGSQLIGVNQITGFSVSNGGPGLGFAWQATISSGSVPRTLSWTLYA